MHHLPKEKWTPEFHSRDVVEDEINHHYEHEDGIDAKFVDGEQVGGMLKPKEPEKDDPRLRIPKGKSSPLHDHLIVPKEPEPSPEHIPTYGKAYEHERKEAVRGSKESAGLSPKLPTEERRTPIIHHKAQEKKSSPRKPCSAYGNANRCEGMSCK